MRTIALLGLTVATGMIDAVSFLALGNVFTALMTGNVAFIGFALAGVESFSLVRSLSALAGFGLGAGIAGQVEQRSGSDRWVPRLAGLQLLGLAIAVAGALLGPYEPIVVVGLAAAMGVQTTLMLRLQDPELKGNVLTLTIAGLAADLGRSNSKRRGRQLLSITSLLGGAALGAVLLRVGSVEMVLAVAFLIVGSSFALLETSNKTTGTQDSDESRVRIP